MTQKSPSRRTPQRDALSSPERSYLSGFLSNDRNNETSMFDALTTAHEQHESVRERALRVFELHELREQQRLIEEQMAAEEKRIKEEKEAAERERKLNELKKTTVPKPPPPPPAPEPAPEASKEAKAAEPAKETGKDGAASAPKGSGDGQEAATKLQTNGTTAQSPDKVTQPGLAVSGESKGLLTPQSSQATANGAQSTTQAANPFAQTKLNAPAQSKPNPFAPAAPSQSTVSEPKAPALASAPATATATAAQAPKPTPVPAPTIAKPAAPVPAAKSAAQQARAADAARYVQIHQNLKELRKNMLAESKKPGSPLKGQIGAFRREIRTSIGQLTGVKGANSQPTSKVMNTLTRAVKGEIPSPMIDVSPYILHPRDPVEGAPNNEQLPSLFIYLLNIAAKGIISQFINECSANPKAADPIGVFTAQVFSNKEFSYRGSSLIDILIAKFRIVCPVLFGFRGNDKTEKGRIALGWRRDGGWIPEQAHNDRMTGLGAGFASVALRDFSRASRTNPFPPTNYWVAFADIVNTPLNETSNTQYVVLRALIEGHEKRFLSFYGNAALAALRLAFVEFPKKAPTNAAAAGSLKALAEVLKNEGMALA